MSRRNKNDKIICMRQKLKLPVQARSVLRTLNCLHDARASRDVLTQSVRCVFNKDFAKRFEEFIEGKGKNESELMRALVHTIVSYNSGNDDPPPSRKKHPSVWKATSEDGPQKAEQTLRTTETRRSTSLIVSDSEDAPEVVRIPQQIAAMDYWMQLADLIHLHVVSRTANSMGRRKTYEVFRLSSGWMTAISSLDLDTLRTKLLKELHTFFLDQSTEHDCGTSCRVYALQSGSVLWIQIHVRQPVSKTIRFNATIQHGLVALTGGTQRGRDLSCTKYVLGALDAVLCPSSSSLLTVDDISSRRVKGVSGTEPLQVLKQSSDLERNHVTGRYRAMAEGNQIIDPILDLEQAAIGCLLTSANHETKCLSGTNGKSQLVAETSLCSVVDHSASARNERKRKRIDELGRDGDCPLQKKVQCEWQGETEAASVCWGVASIPNGHNRTHSFRATLKLEGSDVIRGLQAMMDAGYLDQGPFSYSVCQGQQNLEAHKWGMITYS